MQLDLTVDIIRLCRRIDETSRDVYAKLAQLEGSEDLAAFWLEMSNEESEHVSFWKRAEQVAGFSGIPNLFQEPDQVLAELDKVLSRSRDLLARCEGNYCVANAFTLAYRLELYLLHPAFEALFHLLGPTAGGQNPEDDYDSHIAKFIAMFAKHGNVTPELELLGETLQRLWKENKRLTLQSTRDDLTGVLNRRGFSTVSVQVAHLSQRTHSNLAVMMIDLDHFKSINDRLGHAAGDRVLKGTARLLANRLRKSDVLGRYGGDEFIAFLPEVSAGSVASIAEGIRKTIEESPPEGIPVTVSIGFAEAVLGKEVLEDYNQLIWKADAALHQAKEEGRNRVVEYQP